MPLRMGRMAVSPFAFLRGAAAVMAWDLSHTPVTGIQVVIDGDAHINNFGLYGTPQRDVIVDLNDFDEATIGPWEWDLKRLVASVNVAGRENGLSRKERRRAVRKTVGGYRSNIARLSTMGVLDVWSLFAYAERRPTFVKVPNKAWAIVQKTVAKAKRTTNETLLPKVAHRGHDGGWRFQDDPPILTRVDDETRRKVVASLVEYAEHLPPAYRSMLRRYAVADVAHRVVGVGSVGTRAYLVLLLRQRGHGSALPPGEGGDRARARRRTCRRWSCVNTTRAAASSTPQRLLQALGDPLLGYTTIDGRDVLRAADEEHEGVDARVADDGRTVRVLGVRVRGPAGARPCALRRCGPHRRLLRRRRTRSIARWRSSPKAYGDQTERDHAELVKAIKSRTREGRRGGGGRMRRDSRGRRRPASSRWSSAGRCISSGAGRAWPGTRCNCCTAASSC